MIEGKYCTDPDEEYPYIDHRDFAKEPVKDLEAAKKECADACDINEDCKYGEIYWLPGEGQWCYFWTKDVCKMEDVVAENVSFIYKKQ